MEILYIKRELPPFVHVKEENGRDVLGGFMPAIVSAITKWMNLNVTWIREAHDEYGAWNGTAYTGMLGMIARNEVDLLCNPIIGNPSSFKIASFTNPIIYEAFTMLSGKEREDGGLFLYFTVLKPMVWTAIGITLVVIAFTSFLLFVRITEDRNLLFTLLQYVWVYVAYMLRQGPNDKWMLRKKRTLLSFLMPFLIISWIIGVAFMIMNVFQSLLVSKLAVIKQIPVVDTLQELVDKKSVKGLTPREIELHLALLSSNLTLYAQVWQKLEPELVAADIVFSDYSFEQVEKGKFCLIHGHLILRSVISDYFKRKGKCNFHLSSNYFFPFPLLMALKKELPREFKDKFNDGITRLVDADLSGKWFKPIFETAYFCTSYSENELKPLNLKSILGILIIWAGGVTSAIVSLIFENIYFNAQ